MARRARQRLTDMETGGLTEDQKIIREAKERFKLAQVWETPFRDLYMLDVKFANGDSDNGWQWPTELKNQRELSQRPCLTINKTQMHVLMIVNEGRKNKPAIKIRPVGEEASFQAAQAWEALCRHIEYASAAQSIYDDAAQSQVEGGIGYWRVITEYVSEDSFDQEIYIAPVQDHMGVYLDNAIKQKDGSDAKWGFIFEDMDRKEFERQNPDADLPTSQSTGLDDSDDWITTESVRMAEYYRLVPHDDELIFLETSDGNSATFLRSEVPSELNAALDKAEKSKTDRVKTRKVKRYSLEWYKIGGSEILDRRKLKGKYIPIVRVVGRERKIEGRLDRKGLVRTLKDPQRMYNYFSSGSSEVIALQTKTPYVAPAAAIEGNEVAWFNANTQNGAVLTWRHTDENGDPIPRPEREAPPAPSSGFMEGMKYAATEMEMASGQYGPQQANNQALERSPRAINERSRISDTANYDFVDHLGLAIAYTGKIILDMAPYYYDTERWKKIMAEDGTVSDIFIDPAAPKAYQESKDENDILKVVLNPKKGKFLVQADVGPAFATQRQEAWNAFVQIVTGSPELIAEIGDIMFQSADFPLADKISDRIRRKIKHTMPWLLDDQQVGPLVQELQGQVQKLSQDLGEALQKLAEKNLALKGKDEARDVDTFRAETERLGTIANTVSDLAAMPENMAELQQLIRSTIEDMQSFDLTDVKEANKPALDAQEGSAAPGASANG